MTTLTILRGISGSGKSTWARQQNATVVSRDSIREMLFPQVTTKEYYKVDKEVLHRREDDVTMVQNSMIAALLKGGKDVIVDNTSIQFKYVKALAKIGYRYGADVEVKVFDVPLGDAMRRDEFRGRNGGRWVGNEVIKKQHDSFKHSKNMTLDPVFTPKPYSGTPGKTKAFMVDIDGTVASHHGHRSPYSLDVENDDPRQKVIDAVAYLAEGMYELENGNSAVIVMSGRKEDCRVATKNWLRDWGVPYDHLFMRKSGDDRSDNIVKAELFDEFVRDNFDVQFVLDDRDQVVDMWRRMGLDCFQVQPGDF